MARKGGRDRGIVHKKGSWWVRWFHLGREHWEKADSKTQAKVRHGQIRAQIREGTFFPAKFAQKQEITLSAWIERCLEGATNRGLVNDRRYAKRWSRWFGKKTLTMLTIEDLRRHQSRMRA